MSSSTELKREIGLISGICMIVGTIIGSGIFVTPGMVLGKTGSVFVSITVWALCGTLATLGSITFIELGTLIPLSGGSYYYIMKGLGDIPAFLCSWISILISRPAQTAIICKACSLYLISSFSVGKNGYYMEWTETLMTGVIINLLAFINCRSVKLAAQIQNATTWSKLAAIIGIICGGIYNIWKGKWHHIVNGYETVEGLEFSYSSIALALYTGLWSYDGWNQLNLIVEEMKNPLRNLPLAIIIGLPFITVIYILTILSYLTMVSPIELYQSEAVAILWVERFFGEWGLQKYAAGIMIFLVAMSTFGSANGTIFSTGRLVYAAGREGHLPTVLSYLNVNYFTPSMSIAFTAFISTFMAFTLNLENLIDIFSFAQWGIYGAAFLSCLILRWKWRKVIRPFKCYWYEVLLTNLITFNKEQNQPKESFWKNQRSYI